MWNTIERHCSRPQFQDITIRSFKYRWHLLIYMVWDVWSIYPRKRGSNHIERVLATFLLKQIQWFVLKTFRDCWMQFMAIKLARFGKIVCHELTLSLWTCFWTIYNSRIRSASFTDWQRLILYSLEVWSIYLRQSGSNQIKMVLITMSSNQIQWDVLKKSQKLLNANSWQSNLPDLAKLFSMNWHLIYGHAFRLDNHELIGIIFGSSLT